MKKAFIFLFIFLACNALADKEKSFNDTASWAKKTSKNMLAPNSIPLNVNDYCKDASCRAKIANPDEKSLNDGNMATKAAQAFATNEMAQGISANTNKKRPKFKNDQKLRYALIGQENAFEISHDKSNKYVNCDNGNQCLFDDYEQFCHAPTNNPVSCTKVPRFTPDVIPSIFSRGCHSEIRTGHTVTVWNESPYGQSVFWRGTFYAPAWGTPIPKKFSRGKYLRTDGFFRRYEVCVEERSCPTGYMLIGTSCVKNIASWTVSCDLIPECKPISERCIEPKATRTINGVPTTLNCWKYEIIHKCDLPNNCGQFSKCRDGKRECSLKQNGVCIEEKITKICTRKTCRTVTLNCGEQSFCLDGGCYDSTPKLNNEFDKSAAALAALGEAAKGLGNPPKIFTGKPMQCSKKAVGIANCCKNGGWGTDIGIASCNEEEKKLGRAKEKGLTLYVGEYCAEKVLGACIRRKRSYCVYDSKLGKIIQEQGAIRQLGKTLGSADNPSCAALTPKELGEINFDRIDFSEFYPELHSKINLPNPNVIKQRIQSSMGGDSN